MKDIKINNNKLVDFVFKNIYDEYPFVKSDVFITLHSYMNPFESMIFRFVYRDCVICEFNNIRLYSFYYWCKQFYEKTLYHMEQWRKAGIYKDKLAAFLVNNKNIEILSPHRIIAPFETKY